MSDRWFLGLIYLAYQLYFINFDRNLNKIDFCFQNGNVYIKDIANLNRSGKEQCPSQSLQHFKKVFLFQREIATKILSHCKETQKRYIDVYYRILYLPYS